MGDMWKMAIVLVVAVAVLAGCKAENAVPEGSQVSETGSQVPEFEETKDVFLEPKDTSAPKTETAAPKTKAPAPTKAPTKTPAPTKAPVVTKAPDPTKTPAPTKAPEITKTPDPTEAPARTEAPTPPDKSGELSLEEKVGQLFNVRLNEEDLDVVSRLHLGGVTLFAENVQSSSQVRKLTESLQSRAQIPLLISIDEEGGRVSRLNKLGGGYVSAYSIGKGKDPQKAYDQSKRAGKELKSLGFNMDFAPVADIWSNPANSVIGDRAYGTTPEEVSPMVQAAVKGFADAGILSVIKHFPGHGDTAEDSHLERAVFKHDLERLESFELLPFKAGIEAGTDGVMVGHIAMPEITGSYAPADFLPEAMNGILREKLGFKGLIITDALDMGGITEEFGSAEAALRAFEAGADILLLPSNPDAAYKAVLEACKSKESMRKRLDESVERILAAKRKLGLWE
jgi:beta-N-acetylhexosaminidase